MKTAFYRRCSLILLLVGLSVSGCQSETSSSQSAQPATTPRSAEQSPLEKLVISRHDSLMVATSRLYELRHRLGLLRPTLAADSAQPARRALLRRLDAARSAIVTADDAMTDWMNAYHRPVAGTSPDSVDAYFRQQQAALDRVASLTQTADDSARAVVQLINSSVNPSLPKP